MNYFAHALRFLDADPYFVAGTASPDWMSVVDRKVRIRAKYAEPLIATTSDELTRQVARGAVQHLQDDAWFHRTQGFTEISSQLSRMFRQCLGPSHPMRCGFLGHIVTELLLDAVLIERYPQGLDRYYELLDDLDDVQIELAVNQISRGETDQLRWFIPLFRQERFCYDYRLDESLLFRLNRVLMRVKLTALPERVLSVLCDARQIVRSRVRDLLPAEYYPFPVGDHEPPQ